MVYTKIKVKHGGCGIKYTDGKGVKRHALKTPEDGAFECEIEQAKRLVEMGVAEFVGDDNGDKGSGHLDAAQLETMTNEQLKNLAGDLGIDVRKCKKKADFIAAIIAAEVETDADAEDGEDDPDGPPAPGAADPE